MSRFLVLEGLDGAGTTTQTQRLALRLLASKVKAHTTGEPSKGPIGRLLREMLSGQHSPGEPIDARTFALLFAADRMDHLQREITPHLRNNTVVISDRYFHSSFAYQADPTTRTWVDQLNSQAVVPDLTIFLRVRAEVGAQRRVGRSSEEIFEALSIQQRVAAAYDVITTELCARGQRIVILDGELPAQTVEEQIWDLVRPMVTTP